MSIWFTFLTSRCDKFTSPWLSLSSSENYVVSTMSHYISSSVFKHKKHQNMNSGTFLAHDKNDLETGHMNKNLNLWNWPFFHVWNSWLLLYQTHVPLSSLFSNVTFLMITSQGYMTSKPTRHQNQLLEEINEQNGLSMTDRPYPLSCSSSHTDPFHTSNCLSFLLLQCNLICTHVVEPARLLRGSDQGSTKHWYLGGVPMPNFVLWEISLAILVQYWFMNLH